MTKKRGLFWGIFFIVIGILLVVGQFFSPASISLWKAALAVGLVAIIVESLTRLKIWGAFIPLSLLYILFQKEFDWYYISPGILLLGAALASIGFSMLFPKQWRYSASPQGVQGGHPCGQGYVAPPSTTASDNNDDNNPYVKISFGGTSKYLHSTCLTTGQFYASFGELEVFFDQAQLNPAGAAIHLDCSFASIKLYVPRHWQVVDNISATLGGVSNKNRFAAPAPGSPILTINGNVSFGGIEIEYV